MKAIFKREFLMKNICVALFLFISNPEAAGRNIISTFNEVTNLKCFYIVFLFYHIIYSTYLLTILIKAMFLV